jgi:hypothetical protein
MKNGLRKKIIEIKNIDQDLRQNIAAETEGKTANYLIYAVDYVNGQRLQDFVEKYGYPDKDMIGEEGMEAFWLLVQHQDYEVDFQEKCLRNCGFTDNQKAYLKDRVRVNRGRKQLYGTQFTRNDEGRLEPEPIEDKEELEARRKKMGLEPFSEYREKMQP